MGEAKRPGMKDDAKRPKRPAMKDDEKRPGMKDDDKEEDEKMKKEELDLEVIDDEELTEAVLKRVVERLFKPSVILREKIMKRFQANDLRNLVAEVVSAYQAEKRNKWLLESPEVIEEGVFDPGILKAVFTAGGPGSGKSFTADLIFGMRDASGKPLFENASFLGSTGLKYVNSDNLFEKGLEEAGIDPGDLARIEEEDPELWDIIQGPSPDSIRNVAKAKLASLERSMSLDDLGC